MKTDKFSRIFFAVFALVGVIMLIVGVPMLLSGIRFRQTAAPISAVITDIQTSRGSDGDTTHHVYITYEYNGVTYQDIRLSEYNSSMRVGKEIEVYCDPKNPAKVSSLLGMYLPGGILLGMGVIFALIGTIPLIFSAVKRSNAKKVMENGRRIYGIIDSIDINPTVRVNGKCPYVLYCSYTDSFSGITYRFKSANLWSDPYPVLTEGGQIEIFVMPDDYSKYYVNVEGALAGRLVDYT